MSDVFTLGEYWKLTPTSLKIAICVNEYKQEVYDSISRIEQKSYKKNSWIWAIRCVSEAHGLMSSRTFGSAKCSSLREREFSEDKPPHVQFLWFVFDLFLFPFSLFFFVSILCLFFSPIFIGAVSLFFTLLARRWRRRGFGGPTSQKKRNKSWLVLWLTVVIECRALRECLER